MSKYEQEQIIKFLEYLSEKMGDVVNERDSRELDAIISTLEDEWKIKTEG